MAKNVFKATDKQLEDLYAALKGGAPLLLALEYAQISRATYYYWVAVASVVVETKSQEELEDVEEIVKSGISLQQVREMSESAAAQKRTSIGTFIEPSAESILQYKNSKTFRKFADKCYEVVCECNKIRSGLALVHLSNIRRSTEKGNRINASGSMWFLERTLSDFFAKPSEKAVEESGRNIVEPVKVEYINPDTDETKERVREMEEDLERVINGEAKA